MCGKGPKINAGSGKTEVMGISKRNEDLRVNKNIVLGGRQIPQVERYEYLEYMITEDDRSEEGLGWQRQPSIK